MFRYLINDPKYLLARTKEAFVNAGYLRNSIKPRPGSLEECGSARAGLVIEGDPSLYSTIIMQFHDAFGENSIIYKKIDDRHLVVITSNRQETERVLCTRIEANVLFWPKTATLNPIKDQLVCAYLAIIENGVNIAVISHGLAMGQTISVGCIRDHMLFTRTVAQDVFNGQLGNISFTGKILRLLPAYAPHQEGLLEEYIGTPVKIDAEGFFENETIGAGQASLYKHSELPRLTKSKPVVFVFPIFIAVGGVERNTIEIIRQLRNSFDFIIITMERLRPEQGSLAAQAHEVAAAVIEMSEISRQSAYFSILSKLKSSYQPDLIWVCNGSPWFCNNAVSIRKLFLDTPIVDQEVYDEKRGWITRYHEAGIQSFDHYIAVNKKIQARFLRDFAINPEQVSLIYSAIDASRIIQFKVSQPDTAVLREKYGLPAEKKIFTFVARLTKQKRPLLFLELVKSRLKNTDEYYVFVGDGEMACEALKFIEENNLNNVLRISYIENTLELHAVSDGIIFTSEYEGLPIAMIEAITMGVPVFATDVGDIGDVLNEFDGGAVQPVTSTAQQMIEAYDVWMHRRSDFVSNLVQNEQNILDRFSSVNISKQYELCWNNLISRYQQGAA